MPTPVPGGSLAPIQASVAGATIQRYFIDVLPDLSLRQVAGRPEVNAECPCYIGNASRVDLAGFWTPSRRTRELLVTVTITNPRGRRTALEADPRFDDASMVEVGAATQRDEPTGLRFSIFWSPELIAGRCTITAKNARGQRASTSVPVERARSPQTPFPVTHGRSGPATRSG